MGRILTPRFCLHESKRWQTTLSVTQNLVLTVRAGESELQEDRGIVMLLTEGHMEIKGTHGPNQGKTFKAIYERNGDIWWVTLISR